MGKYGLKAAKHADEVVDVVQTVAKYGDDVADVTGKGYTKLTKATAGDSVGVSLRSGGSDNVADTVTKHYGYDAVTGKKLAYSKYRPKYGKNQVQQVWDSMKNAEGRVFDPNTYEELFWDKSRSRAGQWDMGHTKDNKHSEWHHKYMNGDMSKKEFLDWYRDPINYAAESVNANRSHRFE